MDETKQAEWKDPGREGGGRKKLERGIHAHSYGGIGALLNLLRKPASNLRVCLRNAAKPSIALFAGHHPSPSAYESAIHGTAP